MLNRKRIIYSEMTETQKDEIERRLLSGESMSSIYSEDVFNYRALQKVVQERKIQYTSKRNFPRKKKKAEPKPVKIEDIPRLCLEEMSDRIKNLNTLWRPTKNIGEQL